MAPPRRCSTYLSMRQPPNQWYLHGTITIDQGFWQILVFWWGNPKQSLHHLDQHTTTATFPKTPGDTYQAIGMQTEMLWHPHGQTIESGSGGDPKQDILHQLSNLNTILQHPSNLQWHCRTELNVIDKIIMAAKHWADNQCCKFKSGKVPWCPNVTTAINKILFWKSILKQESGGKVRLSILWMRAKKAGLETVPFPSKYSIQEVQALISKAYKQFCHFKKDKNWWDTWIPQLTEAQATAWRHLKKPYGSNYMQ